MNFCEQKTAKVK